MNTATPKITPLTLTALAYALEVALLRNKIPFVK
jgi:hypothetical protein